LPRFELAGCHFQARAVLLEILLAPMLRHYSI
jgi:hypothetical protein